LQGQIAATGLVLGRSGKLMMRYAIDMTGTLSGSTLTLEEQCVYDNGTAEERCWQLEFAGDAAFTATAEGVVGQAVGWQRGPEAFMKYRYRIPRRSGSVVVTIQDRFFLMDDGSLFNRGRMSKFGFTVGELYTSLHHRTGESRDMPDNRLA
ncbi:MAG: DUF3833 family protein, partial [Rhodobacteraceae bacterium]|nr:DUF3833 family protein [Paracoccaceae bacterium]